MRLLIIGGYGTFGGRLAELLMDEPRLEILIAGRSSSRAVAFCATHLTGKAQLVPAVFDRLADVPGQLHTLAPDVVVDASGPFQAYGEERYAVIEACIRRGTHYLDLADGSEFVAGVATFDAAARSAGVYVLSGVSSFPVLTAAVVRRLSIGMRQVSSIRGGIAPSPYAGVGENVIRAIAGYAGKPVSLRRGNRSSVGHPWTESLRFTIAPPGKIPLKSTLFSLVDVPDLRTLPTWWPESEEVWMGAGPVPELLHRALVAFAWLVRWRLLPSLAPLAHLMFVVANRLKWGEHRGGMFVAVRGTDGSLKALGRTWHLLAEGDDGPYIPSMAIEAIIRKALESHAPAPGARPAVTDLELSDYEALFASRAIHTGVREESASGSLPLFARLLGDAWQALPEAVRQLHTVSTEQLAEGRCIVERGPGLLANCAAWLFGFPKAAQDLPVSVQFIPGSDGERWLRKFGEERFSSELRAGRGRSEHLLCERIGLLEFAQALVVEGDRLWLRLRRWTLFGLPLPLWLAPRSNSYETEVDGRFRFHVDISHPLTGPIVRYRGWLSVNR